MAFSWQYRTLNLLFIILSTPLPLAPVDLFNSYDPLCPLCTGDLSAAQLKALLGCLVDGPTRPLPPLNWTAVLSPVLRLDKGKFYTS